MVCHFARFRNVSFEGELNPKQIDGLRYIETPRPGAPPMRTVHDVYVYPFMAGVFDAEGHRVAASSPYHVADDAAVSDGDRAKYRATEARVSSHWVDVPAFVAEHGEAKEMPKPTIFLGNYSVHYGHWITDGMARLWAELGRREGEGRALVPIFGAAAHRGRPYVADVLDALDLNDFQSARPKRLRHYPTMMIPEPAFQLRHRIYQNAAVAHELVAHRVLPESMPARRPVYISRSRLADGMRSVVDEDRIEAIFAARGFEIVHPQETSFREQVALFNSAPIIAGLAGSSFHTGMFSLPDYRGTLLVLTGDEGLNGRLILQGAIKEYRTVFAPVYRFKGGVVTPDIDAVRALVAALAL